MTDDGAAGDGAADEGAARFVVASDGFAARLAGVGDGQWHAPTPCSDWDVRALANHVAQANLNYVRLLSGASAAEFLRLRDADALGGDPHGAFIASAASCARAFAEPGALDRTVDHPSGRLTARQALAVRTADTVIHTWDLARAVGAGEELDAVLLAWLDATLEEVYAGMAETPVSAQTTHRFYAPPPGVLPGGASIQDRLLHRFGRDLAWPAVVR